MSVKIKKICRCQHAEEIVNSSLIGRASISAIFLPGIEVLKLNPYFGFHVILKILRDVRKSGEKLMVRNPDRYL